MEWWRRRNVLSYADPVDEVRSNLPARPMQYGAEMTMPSRDVTLTENALMPRLNGQPAMVLPQANAATQIAMDMAMNTGSTGPYVRRSQNRLSPMNPGVGHAMFVEAPPGGVKRGLESLSHYGPARWVASGEGAVDVAEIQRDIVRALRSSGDHQAYGTTAAALARDAAPRNIVNGAGLWDDMTLTQRVWDDVLEPRGITAVRTPDGLILFDPSGARLVR